MKKIILFTILAGLLTACTVEEETIEINSTNLQTEDLECVIDTSNPPAVLGTTWLRTTVIIENDIDGNGDGIFSNDLMVESTCGTAVLQFRDDFTANNPMFNNFFLDVDDDGNGNLSQTVDCLIGDGIFPNYTQDGNVISFCYSGELAFTATLAADEQTITFNLDYEDYFFNNNNILNADGTVAVFQSNVIITYTRQ
ncbi:hypothetical protein [Kordia sp.]|uniref:hypothetical protein n=1 Tax=Kordia sp. TaxID=1965332 RepID=UPI003D27B248